MKIERRAFLRRQGKLLAFWWFEQSADQSIYFGSSNANRFTRGITGRSTTSANQGVPLDIAKGRSLNLDELGGKISVHGSGVINLTTRANRRRDRCYVPALRGETDAMPLALVLPMNPANYPASPKMVRAHDLLVDVSNDDSPFAILFYINRVGVAEPSVLANLRSLVSGPEQSETTFGHFTLRAFRYRPRGYRTWLDWEGTIVANPTGEVRWPLVN